MGHQDCNGQGSIIAALRDLGDRKEEYAANQFPNLGILFPLRLFHYRIVELTMDLFHE